VHGLDALVGKIEVKNEAAYTGTIIATDEVLADEEHFIAWSPMKKSFLCAAKLQGMMTWSFDAKKDQVIIPCNFAAMREDVMQI
jgi:hypothetical protein